MKHVDVSTMSIPEIVDRILELEASAGNRKSMDLWRWERPLPVPHFHGVPRPGTLAFTVGIEMPMWAELLGFDLMAFYNIPEVYYEDTLKIKLYRYLYIKDDTPLTKDIVIWPGAGFEESIFGLEQVYTPDADPWVGKSTLLEKRSDLLTMEKPDFYESGYMPQLHSFYDSIGKMARQHGMNVVFPFWQKGPFGIALRLRGVTNLFMDMITAPSFVRDLMDFLSFSRQEWTKERANFLGTTIEKGDLINDDVDSTMISPEFYEQFILPYEKQLSSFHGGIRYWHSCANVSSFYGLICNIDNIGLLDVGPWSDVKQALQATQGIIPLEIRLHPKKVNIYTATDESIRNAVNYHIKCCKEFDGDFCMRVGGLSQFSGLAQSINSIKRFLAIARGSANTVGLNP